MVMIPKSVFYKMTYIVFSVFAVVYLSVSLVNILNVAYSDYLNCINELKYSATIDGTRGMICTYIRNGYEYEQPVSLPNNSEVYVNNYHNNQCSVFYNDGHGVEWYIDRVDVSNVSINEIERDYFYGVKKYTSKEYMFRIIRYSLNSIKKHQYTNIAEYKVWALSRRLLLSIILTMIVILLSSRKWVTSNLLCSICTSLQMCIVLATALSCYIVL